MNYQLFCRWIFILIVSVYSSVSFSHQLSTAYLNLKVDPANPQQISGQLQIRLFDLESSVGIDADQNGQLLWQEVLNRQPAISDYLAQNLLVSSQQKQCFYADKTAIPGQ